MERCYIVKTTIHPSLFVVRTPPPAGAGIPPVARAQGGGNTRATPAPAGAMIREAGPADCYVRPKISSGRGLSDTLCPVEPYRMPHKVRHAIPYDDQTGVDRIGWGARKEGRKRGKEGRGSRVRAPGGEKGRAAQRRRPSMQGEINR